MLSRKVEVAVVALALTVCCRGSLAAGAYDDVAVIVNLNSSTSVTIADYFASARSIPAKNIIYVSAPTAEEIDSLAFEQLRSQIESHLQTNNLTNQINYLVTTKGVPLKVNRGNVFSTSSPSSSVESDLACILGPYSQYIGKQGRITSPYYYQSAPFSRAAYGIYLVTRLDGYTLSEVLGLIDRGGQNIATDPSALYVFDQDPDWNSTLPSLNNYLTSARNILAARGKNVKLNTDTSYVVNSANVIGYVSWGSNDHHAADFSQHALPHNAWTRGAISETYVSTSARSFEAPPTYGQSLIADLISEGVTGAKGYVYEPFSNAMAVAFILMDRYTSGYNLAESFFMASSSLSWMDVVVGDPKTGIAQPAGGLPVELLDLRAEVSGNSGVVELVWHTISERENYGFMVQRSSSPDRAYADINSTLIVGHGTTLVPQTYRWTDRFPEPGARYYRLRQIDRDGTEHFSESVCASWSGSTEYVSSPRDPGFELRQNFPNPFNPSTAIVFSLTRPSRVTLKVYDAAGREVGILMDGTGNSGEHRVLFRPDATPRGGLASGVYIYRLQVDEKVASKRMTYVK